MDTKEVLEEELKQVTGGEVEIYLPSEAGGLYTMSNNSHGDDEYWCENCKAWVSKGHKCLFI